MKDEHIYIKMLIIFLNTYSILKTTLNYNCSKWFLFRIILSYHKILKFIYHFADKEVIDELIFD